MAKLHDRIWLVWELNTPTEERFRNPYIRDIDLDRVNILLQWNPYPPNREETRRLRWERNSEDPTPPPISELEKLDRTMKSAEYYAERLANYHEGRVTLVAQHPSSQDHKSYKYWLSRYYFYQREIETLGEEDDKRESRSVTPEIVPYVWERMDELAKARGHARHAMGNLAALPGGQELVEADPNYWLDREEWRKEFLRDISSDIECCDYSYRNRSMTPEMRPLHHLGTAEREVARNRACKAIGDLARLPAVRALLEGEVHGENRMDPEYWSRRGEIYSDAAAVIPPKTALERARRHAYTNRKKLATFPEGRALLRNEDHGDLVADPEYWRKKEVYYYSEYKKLVKSFWDRLRPARFNREETTLREAMNGAFGAAIGLSSHHEGRAILEDEDLRANEEFKYWEGRRDYYRRETVRIEGESKDLEIGPRLSYGDDEAKRYWKRLKSTFSRIKPPDRQYEDLSHLLMTPPQSPTTSTSKKRARRSSAAPEHRPLTRNARGNTNVIGCVRESNGTGGAVENTTTAGEGVDRRSSRSVGRRESKNAYRHRTKGAMVKPSYNQTLTQEPRNGLRTPNSGNSSNGQGASGSDRDYSSRLRNRPAVRDLSRAKARTGPFLATANAYLTPDSPHSSKVGGHKRYKRMQGSTQSKRRSNRDGAYRGSKSVSQVVDPISSRLRSSGIRLDEELRS